MSLQAADHNSIRAEMTATERCALFRFQFPDRRHRRVLIETSRPGSPGGAAVDNGRQEITGFNPHRMDAHLGPHKLPNFRGYFVVQFSRTWQNARTYGTEDKTGRTSRGAYAEFRPGELVEVRVGTSFLSIDQARANLQHEIPQWDFDAREGKAPQRLERQTQSAASRRRDGPRKNTSLYSALSCVAVSADVFRIRPLLQRL